MENRDETRDRILEQPAIGSMSRATSCVTTNPYAQHMGIGRPVTFYYHSATSRQIIAELFGHYEAQVDGYLRGARGAPKLMWRTRRCILESIFRGFVGIPLPAPDLEHLLNSDEETAGATVIFAVVALPSGHDHSIRAVEARNPVALQRTNAGLQSTAGC